jgi:hypothetical protein
LRVLKSGTGDGCREYARQGVELEQKGAALGTARTDILQAKATGKVESKH